MSAGLPIFRFGQRRCFASGPVQGLGRGAASAAPTGSDPAAASRSAADPCEASLHAAQATAGWSRRLESVAAGYPGPLVSSKPPWASSPRTCRRPRWPRSIPRSPAVLDAELRRQQGTLEMIASENFVPQAVLEAVGSVLTNKYAEGYPGRRYYGGCEEVDVAEQLAIDRAKELFGAEHANVQPHAGAQANNAAYMALIEPGDTIIGHGARPRRPPHPRDEAERLRQALRRRRLPRAPRGPAGRHGGGRAARRTSTGRR